MRCFVICDAYIVESFKLSSEEVVQPVLKKGNNAPLKMVTRTINEPLVLVPVHTGQSTNMGRDILQCISKSECVNISETILDVGDNNKLGKTQNFAAQMKHVSFSCSFVVRVLAGFKFML